MRFGDDVVDHNVDHGAGRKSETVGKDRDHDADEEGAQNARNGLHQPAQLTVPNAPRCGESRRLQRHADGQTLWEVLNADADGQVPAFRRSN